VVLNEKDCDGDVVTDRVEDSAWEGVADAVTEPDLEVVCVAERDSEPDNDRLCVSDKDTVLDRLPEEDSVTFGLLLFDRDVEIDDD